MALQDIFGAKKALQHPPTPASQPSAHGFLPTLAIGLTSQDRRRIEDALDRSVSANTRRSYASDWRSFERGPTPAASRPCLHHGSRRT